MARGSAQTKSFSVAPTAIGWIFRRVTTLPFARRPASTWTTVQTYFRVTGTPGCTWRTGDSNTTSSNPSQTSAARPGVSGAQFYEHKVEIPLESASGESILSATPSPLLVVSSPAPGSPVAPSATAMLLSLLHASSASSGLPAGTGLSPSTSGSATPVFSANSTSSGGTTPGYVPGTFSAPHIVMYAEVPDHVTPWPRAADLLPINRFLLSFWTTDEPTGTRLPKAWLALSEAERAEILADYRGNGIAMMISVFGEKNMPTAEDPAAIAKAVADFCLQNQFDGVDVNYEGALMSGTGVTWLNTFQAELRKLLPSHLISHAPQPPHFQSEGGYTAVHAAVGSGINWYNVQFYNQGGANGFDTCATLVTAHQGMALMELGQKGIPLDKLVIGKPVTSDDVNNSGLMQASALAECVEMAKGQGWNGGLMGWKHGPLTFKTAQSFMSTAWGE